MAPNTGATAAATRHVQGLRLRNTETEAAGLQLDRARLSVEVGVEVEVWMGSTGGLTMVINQGAKPRVRNVVAVNPCRGLHI